jgi:hypothetical protein
MVIEPDRPASQQRRTTMLSKPATSRAARAIALMLGLATLTSALPTSADAGEMMMRRHGMGRMGGMGGMTDLGPGLALGLGAALLFDGLGHREIHRQAEDEGWTPRVQRKHDCYRANEWLDLRNKAAASLRWSKINDPGGIPYDTWRIQHADEEYQAAKRACARQWF